MPNEFELLLTLVDQGFDHASWHGPNLMGAIRGVTARQASQRPRPNRHNIWEQVVHAAYWKYIVRRSLTGEKRGSFPVIGSNWFVRPPPGVSANEREWRMDVALLTEMHRALREAIADLPPARLNKPLSAKAIKMTPMRLITGIAMHDIYHAGQIGLIKRMTDG